MEEAPRASTRRKQEERTREGEGRDKRSRGSGEEGADPQFIDPHVIDLGGGSPSEARRRLERDRSRRGGAVRVEAGSSRTVGAVTIDHPAARVRAMYSASGKIVFEVGQVNEPFPYSESGRMCFTGCARHGLGDVATYLYRPEEWKWKAGDLLLATWEEAQQRRKNEIEETIPTVEEAQRRDVMESMNKEEAELMRLYLPAQKVAGLYLTGTDKERTTICERGIRLLEAAMRTPILSTSTDKKRSESIPTSILDVQQELKELLEALNAAYSKGLFSGAADIRAITRLAPERLQQVYRMKENAQPTLF